MKKVMLVVVCAVLFSCCDFLAAKWGKERQAWALAAVILAGPFAFVLFGRLCATTPVALVSGWVNVTLALFTIAIGIVVFRDRLTIRQWIGLAFAVVGLAMLVVKPVESTQVPSE